MSLLREISEDSPRRAPYGWHVGQLSNHGVMLHAHGFELKLSAEEVDKFFDLVEAGKAGEILDLDSNVIQVLVRNDDVVLSRLEDSNYPAGIILDLETLNNLGIEQLEPEEDDELAEFDDTIAEIDESVKAAFRRSGKKIKRGFRVTSGFRKGRVVSSAAGAFKPRAKASTRMKLKIASRRKKFIRILKGKMTRRKPTSKRLASMNKRIS